MRSERLYLVDIDEAVSAVKRWMEGCDESRFQQDEMLQMTAMDDLPGLQQAVRLLLNSQGNRGGGLESLA
ncbi:MAG: hypothetical protein Q8O52_04960 [Sulfuritalea sp.]|nr:hypothetical protein [Sulfuritalea sp.]